MDHQGINIRTSSASCGILELSRISAETDRILFQVGSYLYHPSRGEPAAFLYWSDLNEPETPGNRLLKRIKELKLAKIYETNPAENPKTGSVISVITAEINHINFKNWYKKERINRIKKQ